MTAIKYQIRMPALLDNFIKKENYIRSQIISHALEEYLKAPDNQPCKKYSKKDKLNTRITIPEHLINLINEKKKKGEIPVSQPISGIIFRSLELFIQKS